MTIPSRSNNLCFLRDVFSLCKKFHCTRMGLTKFHCIRDWDDYTILPSNLYQIPKLSNISHLALQLLLPNPLSQVLSQEWRCSWSRANRWCSNYNWVVNNFIAYLGAAYITDLKVFVNFTGGTISDFTKAFHRSPESHSYLAGVTMAKLWWHLSNMEEIPEL